MQLRLGNQSINKPISLALASLGQAGGCLPSLGLIGSRKKPANKGDPTWVCSALSVWEGQGAWPSTWDL